MRTILWFLLLVVSCAGLAPQGHTNLDAVGVHALLGQKESLNLFVLNVHTPFQGELNGTDAFIEEFQNLSAHASVLPADKGRPILVYCRSGRMSEIAIPQLERMGYKNIYHADGGMIAYDEAGFEVLNKSWAK